MVLDPARQAGSLRSLAPHWKEPAGTVDPVFSFPPHLVEVSPGAGMSIPVFRSIGAIFGIFGNLHHIPFASREDALPHCQLSMSMVIDNQDSIGW